MKARSKLICEHSIAMAISAIEIYNKPNFGNREQIFSILMICAWESLLKAKLIKDNGNKISAIYIKNNAGRFKKNRNQENMTVSIDEAIQKFNLPEKLVSNVKSLIRIRDAAIHLTAESAALPYLTYSLGAASLKNYAKLITEWFDVKLSEYEFFILPLGFNYPFKSLTLAQVKSEPETIANIINDLENGRPAASNDDGYFLICEIQTSLISAKKITEDTDLVAKVDPEKSGAAIIVNQKINLIDQYPYSWTAAFEKIKSVLPGLKNYHLNDLIKNNSIKGSRKYSVYNFRTKEEERRGPSNTTAVLYNDDFVAFAIKSLQAC